MKIPDTVFDNRCRYCFHGRPWNENVDVPDGKLFSSSYHDKLACKILSISQCGKVEGECLSFHPNWIFGLCGTCQWSNPFHDGYCTRPSGPENKRKVYLGNGGLGGAADPDYWMDHSLSTCDHYKVSTSLKDYIMRDVLQGRSPANFNPDTWEPLEYIEGSLMAKRWQIMQEEARKAETEKAKAAEALRLEKLAQAKAPEAKEEQMSFFD